MSAIPAWKRPERGSFVAVLRGEGYVATPQPDGPGYATRRYVPGEPVDIDPEADSPRPPPGTWRARSPRSRSTPA